METNNNEQELMDWLPGVIIESPSRVLASVIVLSINDLPEGAASLNLQAWYGLKKNFKPSEEVKEELNRGIATCLENLVKEIREGGVW